MNLQEFLGRSAVEFEVLEHPATFDASHLAESIHVSGYHVAKTVLLRVDNDAYVIAVLPATHHVRLEDARAALSARQVELANEEEIENRFLDCEVGALPPFGSCYDMETLVDKSLVGDENIIFEGNTHKEAIRMRYDDFVKLEEPLVGSFAVANFPTASGSTPDSATAS